MASVTTIDVTPVDGSSTFPLNTNDVYGLVETLAVQNIRAVKSSNRIEDAFFEYPVANGKVIEEAIIEMAEAQNFTKVASPSGVPSFSPLDPTLYVKYFNNFEAKQFKTTIRRDDIRAIIADGKGAGVEEVVSQILGTLTEGEGFYDYEQMRAVIESADVGADASAWLFDSKVPASSKGILYCVREMYNAIKATNDANGSVDAEQATPVEDIRIAISESVLNLIDVTELANAFNLSKEELFGKLVVLPLDDNYEGTKILVYDRKALGRATRVYDYTQDIIGVGRYTNHYLTTERAYFFNGLFKCLALDVSQAVATERGELLEEVSE